MTLIFNKHILHRTISFILGVLLAMAPLVYMFEAKEARAQFGGGFATEITQIQNVAQNTISAVSNAALINKEGVMDAVFFTLGKVAVQTMTQSIINWINSGFRGSPAFITDLEGFLLDIADQTAGQFIYGNEALRGLCSPFALDVRIALDMSYRTSSNDYQAACRLSDVASNIENFLYGSFSEGGWAGWLELTQNPSNSPIGAYFEAEAALQARIVNAQGQELKLLDWGDGFLSFKVCSDTDVRTGRETNCTITTPGTTIANSLNKALGAPTDALITADEVNEVLGALFAQLAKQAITGAFGLLGLGGGSGSRYTERTFASSPDDVGAARTNLSYLEAIESEGVGNLSRSNPIRAALDKENQVLALENSIISRISNAVGLASSGRSSYPGCFNVSIPSRLSEMLANTSANRNQTVLLIDQLNALNTRFLAASTSDARMQVADEYVALEQSGMFSRNLTATQYQLMIELDLNPRLDEFQREISGEINRCQDIFDVPTSLPDTEDGR